MMDDLIIAIGIYSIRFYSWIFKWSKKWPKFLMEWPFLTTPEKKIEKLNLLLQSDI